MLHIAINGFGRIGRNFLRSVILDKNARSRIQISAINIGPGKMEYVAPLFKYDTLLGTFHGDVTVVDQQLIINDYVIPLIAEKDPLQIAWKKYGIDWVVDATGRFTHRADAQKHITAGSPNILITAPAHDEDIAIIMGINEKLFDPKKHHIVSMGSCTTNAIMPIIKVVDELCSISSGAMTTIHAYTNTQVLLDNEGEDLRRSRAAALNIIPTSTGADSMIQKIFPSLQSKIISSALRVPVAKVSFVDFTFLPEKAVTVAALNQAFETAAATTLKGIVNVCNESLVSSDFAGSHYSVDIDAQLTAVSNKLGKVCGWYDNEWAYSVRLKDFLCFVAGLQE